MSLQAPPAAGTLTDLPAKRGIAGRAMYRVHRRIDGAWWFSTSPPGQGRFDLSNGYGTCYWAESPTAAMLETFQVHLPGGVPIAELVSRVMSQATWPIGAPPMADLPEPTNTGRFGITSALWAGPRWQRTRTWAEAVRRDGWWSMAGRAQHAPDAETFNLFDETGGHPPTWAGPPSDAWIATATPALLHRVGLKQHGVAVRGPANLPSA